MKNRIVKIVLSALAIGCCLGGSYYMGTQTTTAEAKSVDSEQQDTTEEKMYDTDLIAIVNMDEGVKKNNQTVSYSQSLLGTLDISYEVTGIEAAKQGIENGKYSAYLILPGTFSSAVESINSSPQKAVLEYAISQNLTREAQAQAIYSVGDAYTTLSSGISEVYLSSVLSEVHKVQDSASTIKNNDSRDLTALSEIRGDDLRETIQLPELTTVEKNIDVLDLEPAYEESDEILTQIDDTYQTAWDQGLLSFEEVKTSSVNLEDKVNGENGIQSAYNTLMQNHGSPMTLPEIDDTVDQQEKDEFETIKNSVSGDLQTLTAGISQFDTLKIDQEDYNKKVEKTSQDYQKTIAALGDPKETETVVDPDMEAEVIHNYYELYTKADVDQKLDYLESARIQYANSKLQEYYAKYVINRELIKTVKDLYDSLTSLNPVRFPEKSEEEVKADLEAIISEPSLEEVPDSQEDIQLTVLTVDTYMFKDMPQAPNLSDVKLGDISAESITRAMDDLIDTSTRYTEGRKETISRTIEMLKGKDEQVRTDLNTFGTAYTSLLDAKNVLSEKIQDFNPEEYLDIQMLGGLHRSLSENQRGIQERIGNQNEQYEEYVTEVYKASTENTQKQAESIETAQKASNDKLDTNLANAKALKQSTYEQNKVMLDEIEGILPYTRLGTQENILTYRFMANPLATNDLTVVKAESTSDKNGVTGVSNTGSNLAASDGTGIPGVIFAIPVVLILAIAVYMIVRRKNTGSRGDHL